MSEGITVHGGAAGIDAQCDDIESLSGLYARAAEDTAAVSWSLQRYLFDLGTIGSALLDPAGAAEYEFDLARALDGPHGVSRLALECAATATALRGAARGYLVADHLDAHAHTLLDGLLDLPAAAMSAAATLVGTGDPSRALQRFVTADPGLADEAAAVGVTAAGATPPEVKALALRDGHAVVRPLGVDHRSRAHRPPRGVADLIQALSARNEGRAGEIDVRVLIRPDGGRSVIVDIPGTKSWTPLPTADVTSVVTDGRAISGRTTSYERGVLDAMRRAGVRPDDAVMLVGHSEGGLVAVQTAIDATHAGAYRITHVVTAGAPIGRTAGHIPDRVAVLALENAHDVVPHLDAAANPPRPNVTTATVHHDYGDVGLNHDLDAAYLPGARDVDASSDASVRAFLSGAGAFFDAEQVHTYRYVVSRAY